LVAWVIEMGGSEITAAFPGSAIGLLASVQRRFQSQQSSGRFAVGARSSWSPAGLRDFVRVRFGKSAFRQRGFPEPAAVGAHWSCSPADYCGREWCLGAFRVALVSSLRVVSFGQHAQARGRASGFRASAGKSVLGFMGSRQTRRSTGRRGGTAASTKLCRPGAG
jgi:hypothetical protein